MKVYETDAIRNVVLLSHSGAGKTSLAEAMLLATGAITRLGNIAEGNTTCDYEPEEIARTSSIQLAIAPCEWHGVKLNVIDTPGYADFAGDVSSAMAAAECGLVVVSAVDGIEVGTELTWNHAQEAGLPRFLLVNKLDRDNADFFQTLDSIRERFGNRCVALTIPEGAQSGLTGVINLLDPSNADKHPRFGELREQLVEAAAEAEDALTEKYLEEGDLTETELVQGLKTGIANGTIFPILASSATQQVGIQELMDTLATLGPSPIDVSPTMAQDASGGEVAVSVKDQGPVVALVFKTTADPYVGKLSYFKVLRNTLSSDSHVWNPNKEQQERLGQIFAPRGKTQEPVPSLSAGDIGAVAKLQHTGTGDTITTKDAGIQLPAIEFPAPVYSVALSPKTKADMDKMGTSLVRLIEEDPSLHVTREQATGETMLSGLGEAHIGVAAKRLKRKFGVDVLIDIPQVPYRETITTKINAEYKHKKQTGGHGQYGHVLLELEPLPSGSGIKFDVRVVGGTVPKEYFPAVEKGVKEASQHGVLSGRQVVDVKITLYDGSYHPVDSSGMAFQLAASQALRNGLQQARPVILEPVMHVKITVPDAYTGDIMGDLNGKRARVQGMTPDNGTTIIEAQAPLSEMQRYATDLRSMTQGRGYYTMEFSHYEELPQHLAQKVTQEVHQREQV
ncbi:MAG: elongation factor G [Chloroflexi bacterium]|nr:elongation factor G [Chloroflexota bacterium]